MAFTVAVRNAMLGLLQSGGTLEIDTVKLHTDDPTGDSGETSLPGTSSPAPNFGTASNGTLTLQTQIDFTGLGANVGVGFFSVWDGATYLGSGAVTGAANANGAGAYSLTTGTTLNVT